MEQQPAQRLQHVLTYNSDAMSPKRQSLYKKKHSLPSNHTSSNRHHLTPATPLPSLSNTNRKVFAASPRRYTVIPPPDIADKFWVPAEIALNSKLERQRRSLPNTQQHDHETFKELEEKESQEDSQGKKNLIPAIQISPPKILPSIKHNISQ